MPRDELTRPLGLTPRRSRLRRFPVVVAAVTVTLAAGAAVAGGVWLNGGGLAPAGPTATAAIASAPARPVDAAVRTASLPQPSPTAGASLPPSAARVSPAATAPTGPGLVEVTPTGSLAELGAVRIYDPAQGPRTSLPSLPDAALIETGPYGPLPKVALSGLRPLD